jgi:hypothetical protein
LLLSANGREEANPAHTVRSVGVLLCRHHTESRNDSVPHNATILGGITMLYRGTANYSSSALSAKSRFSPIPVRTENIVPVFAMGSTERKWHMEKEHYHKIITYQTTVSILKSWMRAGLVTPEEFQKINTIIAERSGLSLCSIFLDSCPIVR